MDGTYPRFLHEAGSRQIVEALQRQQYLHPHQSLGLALDEASLEVGFCPGAAKKALDWLGLDEKLSIGRLRGTELMQLAQSINRYWREQLAALQRQAV